MDTTQARAARDSSAPRAGSFAGRHNDDTRRAFGATCPRCSATAGQPCRTPKGAELMPVQTHAARFAAVRGSR